MPTYSYEQVCAILRRHGLAGEPELLPNTGMENEAWATSDSVVRIPFTANGESDAELESRLVPLAVEAGVRTPRLIAFSDERLIVPRAYTIYERAAGRTLGTLPAARGNWIDELADQIALLHSAPPDLAEEPQRGCTREDAEDGLRKSLDSGALRAGDAGLMSQWIDRLEPAFESPYRTTLVHNDFHPWNMLVDENYSLTAVLDWGDGGTGDFALDLNGMPAWAMVPLVERYRRAGGCDDPLLEGRVLCEWITIALWEESELSDLEYQRDWWRWTSANVRLMMDQLSEAGEPWRQWVPNA